MKRSSFKSGLILFLILILLSAPVQGAGPVSVKEKGVRLRDWPSASGEVLATASQGVSCELLKEGEDENGRVWFFVRTESGEEGWVASWLLNYGDLKWVVVDEELVNLRESPGIENPVVDQVTLDTVLYLEGEEKDQEGQVWYKVSSGEGKEGWIASWLTRPGRVSEPPPVPVEIETEKGKVVLYDIYYHWGKEEIISSVKAGLVTGYPDGTFRPDQKITRAEFYSLIVRLKGIPLEPSSPQTFQDLPPSHWAFPYVSSALKAGYLGLPPYPLDLEPDGAITRKEIAQAAVRASGWESVALSRANARPSFSDALSYPFAPYIQVAEECGLIKGYPDGTFKPENGATRAEALTVLERMKNPASPGHIYLAQKQVALSATRTVTVDYAVVDLSYPNIKPRVYIAQDQVGRLESLQSLASRNKVTVAVPAAYFDKKSSDPLNPDGPYRYIWGNLENDGTFITLTNQGTSIGFTEDNQVYFAPLEVGITGRILPENLDGRTPEDLSFYVSGLNQPLLPDSVRIFTPIYGPSVNVGEAKAVIFRQYKVVEIKSGEVEIPRDGFVLAAPAGSWLYAHFRVGDRVELQYKYTHNVTGELLPWHTVRTTASAGPRLLKGGQIALSKNEERFDDSLLAESARRTAIGLSGSSIIILANVLEPVKLDELALIMLNLGCLEAVNLDGGASCGLYYRGKVINEPRGSLTNILAFTEF
ncbi:MAG: S-layer homology domain-containing protein [bacterium]